VKVKAAFNVGMIADNPGLRVIEGYVRHRRLLSHKQALRILFATKMDAALDVGVIPDDTNLAVLDVKVVLL
jgi:phage-related protein